MIPNNAVSDIESPAISSPRNDSAVAEPPATIGVGATARSAVIWNGGFNLFRDVLQFGTMLVLVRIIAPESYGQFGLTNSVIGFIAMFTFSVFLSHALQVQTDAEVNYQLHFTFGLLVQGTLFVVTNIVAAVLWRIPTYAPVAPYVHAMSMTFLLEWPCELRRKMLERRFDWKRLRTLHAIGLVGSSLLALVMALSGAGTWALLIPGLLVTIPFTIDLFLVARWRPTWEWSWSAYRESFRFGIMRVATGGANSVRGLLESTVLTAVLGFGGYGIYTRAIGLAQMLCTKFATQLLAAIYPVLTRVEAFGREPARAGNLILRLVGWAAIPVAVVFGSLASPVIHLVYGSRWDAVIPLLPWALTLGVLMAIAIAANNLLLARQQPGRILMMDTASLVLTGCALAGIARVGAAGYMGTLAFLLLVQNAFLVSFLVSARGASWRGAAEAFAIPVVMSLACWTLLHLAPRVAAVSARDGRWKVVLWAALFAVLYTAGIRLLFRQALDSLVAVLPARKALRFVLLLQEDRRGSVHPL